MEEQTTEQAEPKTEEPTVIESLVEHVETYTRATVDLAKLHVVQKGSDILANIAVTIVLIVLSALVLVFISIGAALWIGELLGSAYYGFFIVAGFYLVLALLIYLMRDRIVKKPISDSIIDHFID
jgi:hypothetical protein